MKAVLITDGTLKEMPDMPEPTYPDIDMFVNRSVVSFDLAILNYQKEMESYNAALSKCRTLSIVSSHGWKVGDVIEENIHYKLGFSVSKDKSGSAGIVAIPISNNQDDLWKEIYAMA